MTVVSPQAKQPNSRRCISAARQERSLKVDDELCSLIICLVAFKRLQGAKKTDPVVRERLSWRVHASTLLKEKAFNRYYRMSVSTFQELLCIVGPYLVVDYYQSLRRSRGIPPPSPATMLQCALSWLAGGSYHHIRVITGVSTATFYRIVYRVMFAINDSDKLAPQFPSTPQELSASAAAFRSCSSHGVIENCIGVIDGWLCPVRVPRKDECGRVLSFFSGHYQKYGLNVQACSDHLSRFTAFSISSPGGMNDSYAFQRWQLSKALREISGPYFVIGDNAYVQSRRVMTPFNKAELVNRPDRDSYNFHVSQLRIRIEMAFGLLVNKWRILKQPLFVRLRHCRIVISACMRLHNFCITQRLMTTNTSPQQMLQSMARDVRSWNNQDPLHYDASDVDVNCFEEDQIGSHVDPLEVELDDGSRVNLLDEKIRSDLVARIASRNLHRPERNLLRRQNERREAGNNEEKDDRTIAFERDVGVSDASADVPQRDSYIFRC